jgi:chaperonin GroES
MSPTVFMALVEQGLKVFTAIYKRIHRSLKDEFEKLFRLNRLYLEEQSSYRVGATWKKITREDYEADTGVDPVSDPTMVVDAQRMARTQVLAEFKDDPLCDGIEIRRRIFEAASIPDLDKILKTKQDTNPELILQAAELELKSMDIKAGVLLKISQALNNMAQADAKVIEPMQTWTQIQLTGLQNEYDRLNQDNKSRWTGRTFRRKCRGFTSRITWHGAITRCRGRSSGTSRTSGRR